MKRKIFFWIWIGHRICRQYGCSLFLPQVEGNDTAVLQDTAKLRAKVVAQACVIIEPPEGRPCEHHEGGSGSPQPFELPNRHLVVRRRPPVLPFTFEEWNRVPVPNDLGSQRCLVPQYHPRFRRDKRRNLITRYLDPIITSQGERWYEQLRQLASPSIQIEQPVRQPIAIRGLGRTTRPHQITDRIDAFRHHGNGSGRHLRVIVKPGFLPAVGSNLAQFLRDEDDVELRRQAQVQIEVDRVFGVRNVEWSNRCQRRRPQHDTGEVYDQFVPCHDSMKELQAVDEAFRSRVRHVSRVQVHWLAVDVHVFFFPYPKHP